MKDKNIQKGIMSIGVVVATVIGGVSLHQYQKSDHSEYAKISTKSPKSAFSTATKSKTPTIAVYYSHDCKDCLSVADTVSSLISKNENKNGINYLVMDKLTTGSDFMKENGVTETPTFQVRQGKTVIYQYAGTDKTKIKNILNGQNPETKENFDFNK